MVEIAQQEIITLRGRLKQNIALKVSINNDEYFSSPLEVVETKRNGQEAENEVDSIMLIFWKKNFSEKTQSTIAELKENQNVTVNGYYAGRDNGLFRVTELETEIEDEIFI